MKRTRKEVEAFGISFLDVVTCGFGAIILLLMISKSGVQVVLEETTQPLDGVVAELQQQLFEIRGEARVYNRDLNARREQLSEWQQRVARLTRELRDLESRAAGLSQTTAANAAISAELRQALQSLTEEMQRLLQGRQRQHSDLIGGIPVDSEYIIFVIDTSPSMFNNAWPRVLREMTHILDIYPTVKGIQIFNDMGEYMFQSYRGEWIPDTPQRRTIIMDKLRNWHPYSNSSPVEGIDAAIRAFYRPDRKIGIYIFGDDFAGQGETIHQVLTTVERLNPKGQDGLARVRIHAVGFPVIFYVPRAASLVRFAALMRELTERNMGTFVGLNDYRSD